MKCKINKVVIFCLFYFLVISLLSFLNDKITISLLYQNIPLFILYLFLSITLIFDNNNEKDKYKYFIDIIKRIVFSNIVVVSILFILNFIIFSIFNNNLVLNDLLLFSFQLFMILNIISLFNSILAFEDKNQYVFLSLISILYALIYIYGNNIIIINLYRYYLSDLNNLNMLIHYLFWIFIVVLIIYLKHFKKNKIRLWNIGEQDD